MAADALALTRLTTEYVVEEDRLCLRGETAGGDRVTVWLTARMLGVLVPRLIAWLEGQTSGQPLADLRQSMAQEAAVATHEAQPPVAPTPAADAFLTRSIDIVTAEDAMRLVFKEQETAEARKVQVPFLATELRQWLAIVMAACQTAGWPMTIWPDWLREAARPPAPRPAARLH
ncbi:hypothetical protein GWI72_04995 [Microvirga tunisiensis]|uniref:Uncharacterized protein n=1 Tax=Pannonibacter tanglangensis TaxID=2750084 RepID=A0A7X5J887_9HYPH|nr:hypothetical protein [Pannonibacter sp. XCT-53]NBN77622.1 hypothetical protein [Pannonibacter sp. XCT-53]